VGGLGRFDGSMRVTVTGGTMMEDAGEWWKAKTTRTASARYNGSRQKR